MLQQQYIMQMNFLHKTASAWVFSWSSVLWALEVLCCLFWHYFSLIGLSTLRCMVVGVILVLREVYWARCRLSCTPIEHFSIPENKQYGYVDDSAFVAVVPYPLDLAVVADAQNPYLNRVVWPFGNDIRWERQRPSKYGHDFSNVSFERPKLSKADFSRLQQIAADLTLLTDA